MTKLNLSLYISYLSFYTGLLFLYRVTYDLDYKSLTLVTYWLLESYFFSYQLPMYLSLVYLWPGNYKDSYYFLVTNKEYIHSQVHKVTEGII